MSSHACARPAVRPHLGRELPHQQRARHWTYVHKQKHKQLGALRGRMHTHKQRGCRVSLHASHGPATHPHVGRELPHRQLARPVSCVHALDLLYALLLAVSCSSNSLGALRGRMHIQKQNECRVSSHASVSRDLPCQERKRVVRSRAQAGAA